MSIKLFSDLIDSLEKVVKGLKALTELAPKQRQEYRETLEETFRLVDTVLAMVIIRLGDILQVNAESEFRQEINKLTNWQEWYEAERSFRLCKSLRAAIRETETLRKQLPGSASVKDWNLLLDEMYKILATEGELADYIRKGFHVIGQSASQGAHPDTLRREINGFRKALVKDRQRLIQQEIALYSVI